MAKFPGQRKTVYDLSDISETTMASEGYLNLPKDLSILNRRGYASTTRKGVPLVYRAKVDFYLHDDLGTGPSSAYGADLQATMKLVGCQNNWVMRNAAVKFHAAREEMFRKAGIRKKDRGAYSHEIRYNFDDASQTWIAPIDGDGATLAGGTWDVTTLSTERDQDLQVKLVGVGVNEDSAVSATALQIGFSYLSSRAQVPADSNLESSASPALFSVLNNMLQDSTLEDATADNVKDEAQDAQDNPPYDEWAANDTNHDITESVELGRAIAGFGNAFGSMLVDIPFGLAGIRAQIHDAAGTDLTTNGLMVVEVLDIFEMQG